MQQIQLPSLKTMLAICSEARAELKRDLQRGADTRAQRWHRDRGCLLWAIDASGERMNLDGVEWDRTKRAVAKLLAEHPGAVEVSVDSGINIAERMEDFDGAAYEPHFWQATIWRADRPVMSDGELDEVVRRNTAFRNMLDMLDAKGNYRPSLDCSEPVMLAIADRYDELQAARGDDRRAYRYRGPAAA